MKRALGIMPMVLLGLMLPLASIEIGLRLLFPDITVRRFDPAFGGLPRPNLHARTTYGFYETVVTVHTDSEGFRQDPTMPRASADMSPILALGDSFTFGDELQAEDTWPSQLQRLLNRSPSSKRYSVFNAGVSDFGTAQALLMYRRLAPRLKPRVVVLALFVGNDILDNLCLEDGTLTARTDIPCYTLSGQELVLRPPQQVRENDAVSMHAWFDNLRVSRFLAFEGRRATVWNPDFLNAAGRLGVHFSLVHRQGFVESWYDKTYFDPGWQLTRRLIEQLCREVTASRASLILLIIPDPIQVIPRMRKIRSMMSSGDSAMQWFLEDNARPQHLILGWCRELKIDCVDPLPELRAAQTQGKQLYYPINGHWTPLGDGIGATLLATAVQGLE